MENTFENFELGTLKLPNKEIKFDQIEWTKHPVFQGVELKHIITGNETDGQYSYHLVRIEPGKSIKNHVHEKQIETHEVIAGDGYCINNGKKLYYKSGTISIFDMNTPHEVTSGENGLYMFAKFSQHNFLKYDKNLFVIF